MKQPGRAAEDGFTLVELVVMLLLLALVGTTLTMMVGGTGRQANPREIARQIASEARAAWRLAASTGHNTVLTVDLPKRQILVEDRPARVVVPEPLALSMVTGEQLIEKGKVGKIIFFPDGSSTGGEITVGSPERGHYEVRVFWLTGAITTKRIQ